MLTIQASQLLARAQRVRLTPGGAATAGKVTTDVIYSIKYQ